MIFLYSRWMQLPLHTKARLGEAFGFTKTGPTHVSNDRVVDDGYKLLDVETHMNVEAIKRYIGMETKDFEVMWTMMLDKVEGRAPIVEIPEVSAEETVTLPAKTKRTKVRA